jgi:hypothetical protein
MSDEKKRGCFKTGVLGCAALVALGLVFFAGLAGLALLDSRRPVERVEEERSAPVPVQRPATPATAEQLADARTRIPLSTIADEELPETGAGTLELDLSMGEFFVVPSDGAEIEVEGEFDRNRFRLDAEMTEAEDGSWRYRVRFLPRSRLFGGRGGSPNRVTIHVPRGLPLSVVGRIRMGSSDLELGGLSLRAVDLDTGMGEHAVSFSEPTPRPMDSFEIRGSMGQLDVTGLGNASPLTVEARHGMGELRLGLEGSWRNDCDIRARWRMGQMTVDVADDVRVDVESSTVIFGGKSVRVREREDLPPDAPTLRLDLGGSMGEVVVR